MKANVLQEKVNNQSKVGMAPGSKVYIGKAYTHQPKFELISYSEEFSEGTEDAKLEQLQNLSEDGVHWINLDGLHDVSKVDEVSKIFNIHTLLIEDILDTTQRPKSVYEENYIFFTLKMIKNANNGEFYDEQVSIFMGRNWVLSFQEEKEDVFDPVRERIYTSGTTVRKKGSDYLVFSLLDIILDGYMELMDQLEKKAIKLEGKLVKNPNDNHFETIRKNKYQLISLKKMVHPLKEAVNKLLRTENDLIHPSVHKYLHDLNDQVAKVSDSIESLREINDSHRELYFSSLSHRMNKIIEILTIVSTIFIPLTFIVGVYGMNFKNMPELEQPNGYFYTLIGMGAMAFGMLVYFKRKKML